VAAPRVGAYCPIHGSIRIVAEECSIFVPNSTDRLPKFCYLCRGCGLTYEIEIPWKLGVSIKRTGVMCYAMAEDALVSDDLEHFRAELNNDTLTADLIARWST
jgi:hypothetical protein